MEAKRAQTTELNWRILSRAANCIFESPDRDDHGRHWLRRTTLSAQSLAEKIVYLRNPVEGSLCTGCPSGLAERGTRRALLRARD